MGGDKEMKLEDPEIEFGRFGDGRKKMVVRFSNGASWVPKWKEEVCEIYDNALFVEKVNRERLGKGRPKALLVHPMMKILRSHGYLGESMFRFDITASGKGTHLKLTDTIYVDSEDAEKAERKALTVYKDSIMRKLKKMPNFANVLMRVKKIVKTEYVRKGRPKSEIPRSECF